MKIDLPECAANIPAMTTQQERETYYRLTLEAVARGGAIVELGAWLGASTAYIAAAIRDGGDPNAFVRVYDRFISKPAHIVKQQKWYGDQQKVEPVEGSTLQTFATNLGLLGRYVVPRQGEIRNMEWSGEQIALLITDAPKRVPEISKVLTEFAGFMQPGSIMAWQDFSYFASYDIPACLSRLSDHIEFIEGIYPGTTAVFRVKKAWSAEQVSKAVLSLHRWTADEVVTVWDAWEKRLPEDVRARFSCGAAMFLYDIGEPERAVTRLRSIIEAHADEVLPKWRYFRENRPDLVARYCRLFDCIDPVAA